MIITNERSILELGQIPLMFWKTFSQKVYFQPKMDKEDINDEFIILEIVLVPHQICSKRISSL